MHVMVIGAGIAGLSCAYELQQAGHRVTVLDQAEPGSGASAGNGAQLSYSYVQPLADPSVWAQLPKLLFSRHSPLKIRPQWDWRQWAWGVQFLAACNSNRSTRTTRALLALADESRAAFDGFRAREQALCDFASAGKLVLYGSASAFSAAQMQMQGQRAFWQTAAGDGAAPEQRCVNAQECAAIEPALAGYLAQDADAVVGGIYTPSECVADCAAVCAVLAERLTERGAQLLRHTPVTGFIARKGVLAAVHTPLGELPADAFVLAAGSASASLAAALGMHLPIYPLKGYSITLGVAGMPEPTPRVSVTDAARKIVFARIGQRLRVAGMAELVGHDRRVAPARIAELYEAVRRMFPACPAAQAEAGDAGSGWAGFRPATPTGLPLVGRHPRGPRNLLLNTGHGALGFTLAFGTARRVVVQLQSLDAKARSMHLTSARTATESGLPAGRSALTDTGI